MHNKYATMLATGAPHDTAVLGQLIDWTQPSCAVCQGSGTDGGRPCEFCPGVKPDRHEDVDGEERRQR